MRSCPNMKALHNLILEGAEGLPFPLVAGGLEGTQQGAEPAPRPASEVFSLWSPEVGFMNFLEIGGGGGQNTERSLQIAAQWQKLRT